MLSVSDDLFLFVSAGCAQLVSPVPPPREQKVAESFSTSLPFVHFAEYFKNTILPRKGG